jgi:hypothetical protein
MNKEHAMKLHGLWITSLVAGCTSTSTPSGTLPDRFDANLAVVSRSVSHPCGADFDLSGQATVHYQYSYDPEGRSMHDTGTLPDGTLYEQVDYAWDNAGHLIDQRDQRAAGFVFVTHERDTYDPLGRRLEFRFETDEGGAPRDLDIITYSEFDDLGHALHGDQVIQIFKAGTSNTLTRAYGYDELGRRISLDVRDAAGGLFQDWQHVYDDAARTVTTTLVGPPSGPDDTGLRGVFADTFDEGDHLMSSHGVITNFDGADPTISDTRNTWDGDRQLSSVATTTFELPGDELMTTQRTTFLYECPSSGVAGAALNARTIVREDFPFRRGRTLLPPW